MMLGGQVTLGIERVYFTIFYELLRCVSVKSRVLDFCSALFEKHCYFLVKAQPSSFTFRSTFWLENQHHNSMRNLVNDSTSRGIQIVWCQVIFFGGDYVVLHTRYYIRAVLSKLKHRRVARSDKNLLKRHVLSVISLFTPKNFFSQSRNSRVRYAMQLRVCRAFGDQQTGTYVNVHKST